MKPNTRLKREREWRGWSQARLAKEINIDVQSVSRWERGISHPYPALREKLCSVFGKNPEELGLLKWEQEVQSPQESSYPTPSSTREGPFDPGIPLAQIETARLIGRTELLDKLKQQLLGVDTHHLLILRGLPGIGKTTVAATIAHDPEIQEHFRDGILWAGLGATPNLLSHMSRWGTLLGLQSTGQERSSTHEEWAQVIHNYVQQRQVLFILDDVWELETVLALKLGGSRCAYLVTTRIPQVAQYFASEQILTVAELNEQESLSLLEHFVPSLLDDDMQALQSLVQAVGGLPLALALIGRYLRAQAATGQPRRLHSALLRVSDASARLHLSEPSSFINPQPSLSSGTAISLQSVIAVSEQRIGEQERQALRMLSVFPAKPNSFSEEAAVVVCQISVDVLDILSDAGLLESPEPGRYHLHQTIADYARLHMQDKEQTLRHFVLYMVQFAEKQHYNYNLLEMESRNILFALETARRLNMQMAYIQGVVAMAPFFEIRGFYMQATEHLQQAYRLAQDLDDVSSLLHILFHLGQIAQAQNQLFQAETYMREGLRYSRQVNDHTMINHFLHCLSEVLELRGQYIQAQAYLREGLALAGYPVLHAGKIFSHLIPIPYSEATMCVYFTEPRHMIDRGYVADIDDIFHRWRHAAALSSAYLKILEGSNGHLYGIPTHVYVSCLVYNRKLFREAGLDPDRPPTTWEEFRMVAKQVTRPGKGIYGFAAETIYHQGGWHFTSWLYSAGVQAQRYQNGIWQATFHDRKAAYFLTMLKDMRFSDNSIPRQILLDSTATMELLRRGKVAMIIASPNTLNDLYQYKDVDMNDFGLAPMPQHGGNACLMGGTAYVFNPQSSRQAIEQAFEQVVATHFHLDDYEATLRAERLAGKAIGIPTISLLTKELQKQQAEITAKYCNIPIHNYQPFIESKLHTLPEPTVEAQRYYALIDPIIQEILTNPHSQPQQMLDNAAQQMQRYLLNEAS